MMYSNELWYLLYHIYIFLKTLLRLYFQFSLFLLQITKNTLDSTEIQIHLRKSKSCYWRDLFV